jgi:hypothetical protein
MASKLTRDVDDVLVLWLDDDLFGDYPLRRLAQLNEALDLPTGKGGNPVSIRLLGPRKSTTVAAMVQEAARPLPPDDVERLRGVAAYSPTATADDAVLLLGAPRSKDPAATKVEDFLASCLKDFTFHRTIADDSRVCRALAAELRARGVDPAGDHVALVAEWDTLYGRSLPLSFVAAWSEAVPDRRQSLDVLLSEDRENREDGEDRKQGLWFRRDNNAKRGDVELFRYLRGIDGRAAAAAAGDAGSKSGADATSSAGGKSAGASTPTVPGAAAPGRPTGENTEGADQSDYLRRLAHRLVQRDRELRRADGSGIRAIGVLGSDVYDKLLVLQALRPELHDVVFFTTDLDVRLLHPREWAHAHNLIIGSAFGLSLNRTYQPNIPPFRDAYQTSVYAATLHALDLPPDADLLRTAPVRLYEVGRNGAFDLTADVTTGPSTGPSPGPSTATTAGPPPLHGPAPGRTDWWNLSPSRSLSLAALCLVCAALLVIAWFINRRRCQGSYWHTYGGLPLAPYLVLFVTAAVLVVTLLLTHDPAIGEPIALLQGVSIWPTEGVRLLAAGLCVHFLVKGIHDVRAAQRRLMSEYHLHSHGGQRPVSRNDYTKQPWYAPKWPVWWINDRPADTRVLWRQYLEQSRPRYRWPRIVAQALLFVAATLWLTHTLARPWIPARGATARSVDQIVQGVTMFALAALVFFVADVTRLGEHLIRRLLVVEWPEPVRAQWASMRGLQAGDVDGFLDVQLVAGVTEPIGRLLYWPFVVIALLILSRISWFDDWGWPLSFLLVFGALVGYAVYSVVKLRRAAERTRTHAADQLRGQLLRARGKSSPRADSLRDALAQLDDERRGAFASALQHPVLRAFLIPSGGLGVWGLLELIARWGS